MKKIYIPYYTIVRYISWYFVKIHCTEARFKLMLQVLMTVVFHVTYKFFVKQVC